MKEEEEEDQAVGEVEKNTVSNNTQEPLQTSKIKLNNKNSSSNLILKNRYQNNSLQL